MLVQAALLKAIRYCGSKQKKLAQLIGEEPDKISYWLNRAKQIPFHQAIAIEAATDGIVSRYDLAPYARLNKKRDSNEKLAAEITISERVYIGMQLEKILGNRRGIRSDLQENNSNNENLSRSKCAQVKGKTTTIAAKEAGFSSRDTYLRAKKVVERGDLSVIEAMDKKLISIATAAAMVNFPLEEQQFWVQKNRKEILEFIKKNSRPHSGPEIALKKPFPSCEIFQENRLIIAEKHYKLPLRLPLLGLLINCDAQGYFPWDPKKLQEQLLPNMEMNFNSILERLRQIGAIKKIYKKGEAIGQVLTHAFVIANLNKGDRHGKNPYR